MKKDNRSRVWLVPMAGLVLLAALGGATHGAHQEPFEEAHDLFAKTRILRDVGPGVEMVRRDAQGHYAVLAAPGQSVRFYSEDGKLLREVPAVNPKHPAIVFAADFDEDARGNLYVADRGGNAIRIFDPQGQLLRSISFQAPNSLVVISKDEFAVTGIRMNHLVEILSTEGKVLREFGDFSDLAEHASLNRFLNMGRLATDDSSHVFYAFTYFPEPMVRKYDRFGQGIFDVILRTLEFAPEGQATRREIFKQDQRDADPSFKPIIDAMGVDAKSQYVWISLGDELLELDQNGDRRATYRTLTPDGASLRPVSILVEPQQLVLASDPLGIYEFPRPDLKTTAH
jgi:hypothetical protein